MKPKKPKPAPKLPKKKGRVRGDGHPLMKSPDRAYTKTGKRKGKRQVYTARIEDCKVAAWECRVAGLSDRRACLELQKKLNLPDPPDYSTYTRWIAMCFADRSAKTDALREQFLATALPRLEMLIEKWLPLATADRLTIQRYEKTHEGPVPVLDENAYDESQKAAGVVLKTLESMRRILGVGLATTAADAEAVAGASIQNINALIIQTINHAPAPGGRLGQSALVLEAGDPAIDGL